MGVRTTHYVIWGVEIPYVKTQDANGDDIEYVYSLFSNHKRRDDVGTIRLISGEDFSYVGFVLAVADDYDGFSHKTIPTVPSDSACDEIIEVLKNLGITDVKDFNWIVFTNYT